MRTGQREGRVVVVERSPGPIGGAMTRVASGREARRGVSWIRGSVPIRLVASIARCGQ